MKRLIPLLLVGVTACIKPDTQEGLAPTVYPLTVSSYTVAKGQAVSVSLPAYAPSNINWSVTPSTTVQVTAGTGGALILFGQAGYYFIRASYVLNGIDSVADTAHVTVGDSAYTPPIITGVDTVSLNDAQLVIMPLVNNDTTQALTLYVKTVNTYSCFPSIIYSITSAPGWTGGISADFTSIVEGSTTACSYSNPANAYLFPNSQSIPADGTYPLTIQVGTTVYTGSITVTDTTYIFNWSYTSGVIFSPSSINR